MSENNNVFTVGQRVDRIEDREVTGATIIRLQLDNERYENSCAELEYDEGGSGWWPLSAIKPKESN